MEIKKVAVAGTLESSDCQIIVRPNPGQGVSIDLDSSVKSMFGKSIIATAKRAIAECGVTDADVEIHDRGALDCVIEARMQCALYRGAQRKFDWTKEALA